MKLTLKLPLIIILALSLIGVISALLLIYFQTKVNANHYTKTANDIARILVNHVEQGMVHSSPQVLAKSIEDIQGLTGITEIFLYDIDGKIHASNKKYSPEQENQQKDYILEVIRSGNISQYMQSNKNIREFHSVYPLINKAQCQQCHGTQRAVLGAIEISSDAEPYFMEVKQQIWMVSIIGIFEVIVITLLIIFLSKRLILNRLSLLEQGSIHIASGDYSYRLQDTSRDELGLVTDSFNKMAEKVEESIDQLKETIKIRTEERTVLDSIITSMGEGLVLADIHGNLAYCNVATEKLLGIEAAPFLGKHIKAFNRALSNRITEPKDWENDLAAKLKELKTQPKFNFVVMVPERREIEAIFFIVGKDGQYLGTGAMLRDVTVEREVDRIKTQFISIASHELRTPLTIVYGFSELLLKSKSLPQPDREWVERIYKESQRLNNIVEDLLSVSRIESGKQLLKMEALTFQPIIRQLINHFATSYRTHSFNINFSDELPRVLTDPNKLLQVLSNLLDNAAKYSPKGGPVTVSAKRSDDGNKVVISVEDKGLGIPRGEMPKLFTRFHRIYRPEIDILRGTGLGLSIVKSLIELMDGKVWVESVENEGSTFYISLPVAENSIIKDL